MRFLALASLFIVAFSGSACRSGTSNMNTDSLEASERAAVKSKSSRQIYFTVGASDRSTRQPQLCLYSVVPDKKGNIDLATAVKRTPEYVKYDDWKSAYESAIDWRREGAERAQKNSFEGKRAIAVLSAISATFGAAVGAVGAGVATAGVATAAGAGIGAIAGAGAVNGIVGLFFWSLSDGTGGNDIETILLREYKVISGKNYSGFANIFSTDSNKFGSWDDISKKEPRLRLEASIEENMIFTKFIDDVISKTGDNNPDCPNL